MKITSVLLHVIGAKWLKKKARGDVGDQTDGPALGFHTHGELQPFPENKIPNPSHLDSAAQPLPWAPGVFSAPGELRDKEQ